MTIAFFTDNLKKNGVSVKQNSAIAPYTTFRIGGNADVLCIPKDLNQLVYCIKNCSDSNLAYKVIGGGSNILVSDSGFRGVIIINKSKGWEQIEDKDYTSPLSSTPSRYTTMDNNLPHIDDTKEKVLIRIASGMKLPALMSNLFDKDISGLELFAGIPATVGGAIYMNMHGGDLFFGDLLHSAKILSKGRVLEVPNRYFKFDYDYSILHQTKETVLSCDLILNKGQSNKAKEVARQWMQIKKIQPQRSAGCIFHNLTSEDQQRLGYPTPSIGYVIDKILNLKGTSIGGAKISETHAAFIENTGNATCNDVLKLIDKIKNEALSKLKINLVTEIDFIGE